MLSHKIMLADDERVNQLKKAIFQTVKPGDTVIDIGTGTGILSFFACQAGAKKVYAIEAGDIIEMAKAVAMENGFSDKIVFVNELANEFSIKEKADVLLCELVAVFGMEEGLTKIVPKLKKKYLKKTGKIIPSDISLFLAPVYDSKLYEDVSFWDKNLSGIALGAGKQFAANQIYSKDAGDMLFKEVEPAFVYDFYKDDEENVSFTYKFATKSNEVLYGFLGWFESSLADSVKLTNKPGTNTHWDQAFFPLERPITLEGEEVTVKFDGFYLGKRFYWAWKTNVNGDGDISKREFSQSNLSINYLNHARQHVEK